MAYEPFIDDPEHIRAVDRERFVVLRPSTRLGEIHKQLQALLRQRFAAQPISYPAQAHVTLAGFAAGTGLGAVQKVVESWSRNISPLQITVETLACFPAPSQIVIIQVLKTPELLNSLARLRWEAGRAQLKIDTTMSPEDWIFHMSVGYCSKLSGPAWGDVTKFVEELEVAPAVCIVRDGELVAFDNHLEYSGGVYGLRAANAESNS
jgi:2'-5' RNA ligase